MQLAPVNLNKQKPCLVLQDSTAAKKRLGAIIRERRIELGEKQLSLAAKIGVDVSLLSKIETGQRIPSIRTLALLAIALDSPIQDFVAIALYDSVSSETDQTVGELKISLGVLQKYINALH